MRQPFVRVCVVDLVRAPILVGKTPNRSVDLGPYSRMMFVGCGHHHDVSVAARRRLWKRAERSDDGGYVPNAWRNVYWLRRGGVVDRKQRCVSALVKYLHREQ